MYDFLRDFFLFCFILYDFIAHLPFLCLPPLTTHQLLFPTVLFFYLFCIFLLLLFVDMLDPLFGSIIFFYTSFIRFGLCLCVTSHEFQRLAAFLFLFVFFLCEFFLSGFVMFVDSTEILKNTLILKGFRFTNENISIRIETQLKHFLILFLPLLIGIKFPLVIIVSHIFLSLDFACLSLWVGICCLLPSSLYTSLLFFFSN